MLDDIDHSEDWKAVRTPAAVERDARQSRIFGLYRTARIALEYRQVFGRPSTLEIPDAPAWLSENLDESGLAVIRFEFIQTYNEYRPDNGWDYPDGKDAGDWRMLPQDPERLIEWIDNDIREKIADIKASTRRIAKAVSTSLGTET